jgi:hypothetical protein
MTMENFENAWRNQAAQAPDLPAILRQIGRNARFEAGLQYSCVFVTAATTAAMLASFDARSWGAYLLQAVAAATLIVLIRRRIARRRRMAQLSASVENAARTALRDTADRMRELKSVAFIGAGIVLALSAMVYQLHGAGKMDARSVAGFSALLGAVIAANAIGWGLHYARSLKPRKARLEALLASLVGHPGRS